MSFLSRFSGIEFSKKILCGKNKEIFWILRHFDRFLAKLSDLIRFISDGHKKKCPFFWQKKKSGYN